MRKFQGIGLFNAEFQASISIHVASPSSRNVQISQTQYTQTKWAIFHPALALFHTVFPLLIHSTIYSDTKARNIDVILKLFLLLYIQPLYLVTKLYQIPKTISYLFYSTAFHFSVQPPCLQDKNKTLGMTCKALHNLILYSLNYQNNLFEWHNFSHF